MSLTVSMPVKKRLRRKGQLEEEIAPEPGAIAAWEGLSGRYTQGLHLKSLRSETDQ